MQRTTEVHEHLALAVTVASLLPDEMDLVTEDRTF